jgi:branched-chain amino acid transport system ATP-binding protein
MHLFQADNISIFYGEAQAIKDISFHVDEKEIISILGSNAAGKTTLLRSISALHRPRHGAFRFLGEPLSRLGPHEVVEKGIVHIPEGREIFPNMTVLENLELGAHVGRARKNWKQHLNEIYCLFPRLKERYNQLAKFLSGGEQQMLAIGRGMMAKPRLLMLDEPSLGLAPLTVKHIFSIIRTINDSGMTILLVEQNISNALQISNRSYILENGRIVKEGQGAALLADNSIREAYLGM